MKVRILNKQHSHAVILVHGLFTNSGYWLDYIKYFENFKVYLIDFEYSRIEFEKLKYISLVRELITYEQIEFVIGHSFGATFLDYCMDNSLTNIGINPPHLGLRKNNNFINHVVSKNRIKLCTATSELNNIYNHVGKISPQKSILDKIIVTDGDEFLDFSILNDNKNVLVISGNHFDISEALSFICNKELDYVN